ncbi:putative glycosyltransferase EpsE [compost metagenome]
MMRKYIIRDGYIFHTYERGDQVNFMRIPGLVSIMIPCYNSSSFIEETLNSITAQTYPDIEIIIINDGSTDTSLEQIHYWMESKEVQARFVSKQRFQLLNLPYNIGYAGANTIGLFLARGEFIAIHDSDDLSHPERILKQVEFLRSHDDFGLVGTHFAEFWTHNPKVKYVPTWIEFGHEKIKEKYEMGKSSACYGTLLFRGLVFDETGGLIRNLPWKTAIVGHDKLFITRCLQQGFRIDNIPEVLYYYRLHGAQMSGRGSKKKKGIV